MCQGLSFPIVGSVLFLAARLLVVTHKVSSFPLRMTSTFKRPKQDKASSQFITLHSGDLMPKVGLGTWKIPKDTAADNIVTAIRLGYRFWFFSLYLLSLMLYGICTESKFLCLDILTALAITATRKR